MSVSTGTNLAQATSQQYGTKLVSRDYRVSVASLGQARTITRSLMQRMIGDLDPELISLMRLRQMRRDTMIKMGLYYRKAPVLRMKWHIECEGRPDVEAAIDQIIRQRWGSYARLALQKFDFGYKGVIQRFENGVVDAQYEAEDGTTKPAWTSQNVDPIVLDRPIPVPAEYARIKLDPRTGEFNGMQVALPFVDQNPDDQIVPPEWCLWWANEFEESDNNWYGYPLLGYAYRYWWSSWFRHHMEDRHFEMKADPALVVDYPEGTYVDPQGRVHQNRDIALQMGDDLRGGATIAKPSTVYRDPETGSLKTQPLWNAAFLTGGENMQAFEGSREYLDIMKLRACMVPEQALIEGIQGTGARATSAVHESLFAESLGQDEDDLAEGFNAYVIPRIKDANWGADVPRARMVVDGNEDSDIEFYQTMVETAFTLDPNSLPIKWEDVLKNLKVPMYTQKEQKERQDAEQELQAQQAAQNPDGAPPDQVPGAPSGPPTSAPNVNNLGQYYRPRDVIWLHSGSSTVDSDAPKWAHDEGRRRQAAMSAISARLRSVAADYYGQVFKAVADHVAATDLAQPQEPDQQTQALRDAIAADIAAQAIAPDAPAPSPTNAAQLALFLAGVVSVVKTVSSAVKEKLRSELAAVYHASGAAELTRLGLSADTWDVGADQVQDWARDHAGDLIKTMESTVVDQHLRPFLEQRLQDLTSTAESPGSSSAPVLETTQLAQDIAAKFEGYPGWMAERVARTEARHGYNLSAADMWERVGITHVVMYDGLGGASGKTDAECLRRNGQTATLDEFRAADEAEHPNGTLGAYPDTEGVEIKQPEPRPLVANFAQTVTPYALRSDGTMLLVDDMRPTSDTLNMSAVKAPPRETCPSCRMPLTPHGRCVRCAKRARKSK